MLLLFKYAFHALKHKFALNTTSYFYCLVYELLFQCSYRNFILYALPNVIRQCIFMYKILEKFLQ